MEEWGLQAVVRSGHVPGDQFITTTSTKYCHIDDGNNNYPDSCYSTTPFLDFQSELFDEELLFSFPDPFDTASIMQGSELEELYKPFCQPAAASFINGTNNSTPSLSPQTLFATATASASSSSICDVPKELVIKEEEDQIMKPFFGPSTPFVSSRAPPGPTVARGAKHKARKNQQKKVVLHVTADGLSSDLWAWRKYGQKPIKGSPYPRSYYRCSSSKGCLARRQVEQSYTNPGMYIITYTADHNHAQPTRRNSLAGVNRHKFGPLKNHTAIISDANVTKSNDSPIPSPTTSPLSLNSSVEEELVQQQQQRPIIKEERRDHSEDDNEQTMGESDHDSEFVIPDIMLNDDFFAGLGNLQDDLTSSDSSFQNCFTKRNYLFPFVAN